MICELGSLSFCEGLFEDEGIVTSLTLVSITAAAVSATTGGLTVEAGVAVPTGDNTVAAFAVVMLTCFSPSLFKKRSLYHGRNRSCFIKSLNVLSLN